MDSNHMVSKNIIYKVRSSATKKGLKEHMKLFHEDKKAFRCETCLQEFKCFASLLKHEMFEKHIQKEPCTTCPKIFISKRAERSHFLEYHENGKNKCQISNAAFTTKKFLAKHLRKEHYEKMIKSSQIENQLSKSVLSQQDFEVEIDSYDANKIDCYEPNKETDKMEDFKFQREILKGDINRLVKILV